MNLSSKNLLVGVSILLIFISISVFGLLQFSHTNRSMEAPMVNCPYALNGYAICENNINHISAWQQFSNVTVPSIFIFSLLVLGIILYFYNKYNLLRQDRHFYVWKYCLNDKKFNTYENKVIKWLSLFENSPSLSYVRHS